MQFLFQQGSKEDDEDDGDDAAPPWSEWLAGKDDMGQSRMGNDSGHDTTQHGRTAKDFCRIDADKDIETIKCGIAGNGKYLYYGQGG